MAILESLRLRRARLMGKTITRFLHIRKTGGTSVREALGRRHETKSHLLAFQGHGYRMVDAGPGEKVAFVYRDPIERFLSGFNSRLRQGRPRYDNPWDPQEAEVFARFKSAEELAVALDSRDSVEREAAIAAMRNVRHLKHGYAFWFSSPDYLRHNADRIEFVGRQAHLNEDFERLKAIAHIRGCQLPTDDKRAHRAPKADPLSQAALGPLRDWYAEDYAFVEIFENLRKKSSDPQNV